MFSSVALGLWNYAVGEEDGIPDVLRPQHLIAGALDIISTGTAFVSEYGKSLGLSNEAQYWVSMIPVAQMVASVLIAAKIRYTGLTLAKLPSFVDPKDPV